MDSLNRWLLNHTLNSFTFKTVVAPAKTPRKPGEKESDNGIDGIGNRKRRNRANTGRDENRGRESGMG